MRTIIVQRDDSQDLYSAMAEVKEADRMGVTFVAYDNRNGNTGYRYVYILHKCPKDGIWKNILSKEQLPCPQCKRVYLDAPKNLRILVELMNNGSQT